MAGTVNVAALRPLLLPELAVHAAFAEADAELVVDGIAGAVAPAEDGTIEAVIDCKSDVTPAADTVAGCERQVQAYLPATGPRRGLVVFMTIGSALRVGNAAQGD